MKDEPRVPSIRDLLGPVLPPILFRNHPKFKELTGIAPYTVANHDSKGIGPRERIIVGHVTGYPRDAFLDYLEKQSRQPEKRPSKQSKEGR